MTESKKASPPGASATSPTDPNGQLPPIDFVTFILSLSTSAIEHMRGGSAGAESGAELHMARQTIDLIALLQEKTHGNLTGEEERLVERVLFDLRMKFVEAAGRPQKG